MATEQGITTMNPMTTNTAAAEQLSFATATCALGTALVARSAKGVCALLLGDRADELTADLAARFPKSRLVRDQNALADDIAQVRRYLATPAGGLRLVLDLRGTPFQRRVWEELRTVDAGTTVSYVELAHRVGRRTSPRAIARACAANPIALAVPCHRVIRSDGQLAGYRWGLERKRQLIQKEARA